MDAKFSQSATNVRDTFFNQEELEREWERRTQEIERVRKRQDRESISEDHRR